MAEISNSGVGARKLAHSTEDALLNQLGESIETKTASATFACGGSLPVKSEDKLVDDLHFSSPVTLRWDSPNGAEPQFACTKITLPLGSGKQCSNESGLRELIKSCQPATFGRGEADFYDESYRKAGALDQEEFATDFNPYSLGIVDAIAKVLLPSVPHLQDKLRGVDARLYKLNVYSGPSGIFHAHVDTPRSEKQFGSLVVCLPVAHQGGSLLVRHHGNTVEFDWGGQDTSQLHWAAFYSDCEHEVLEVKSGHRVTLTYNLFVSESNVSTAMNPELLPLYNTIKSMLQQPGFMMQGGTLGVNCSHAYAHTAQESIKHLPQSLKGADAAIHAVSKSLGLDVILRPVVENELCEEDLYERLATAWPEAKYGPKEKYEGPPRKGEGWRDRRIRAELRLQQGIGKTIVGTALHPLAFTNSGSAEDAGYDAAFDAWLEDLRAVNTNLTEEELPGREEYHDTYWRVDPDAEPQEYPYTFRDIRWITQPKHKQPAIAHLAYGNGPSDMCVKYSSAALLIEIPPFADRT